MGNEAAVVETVETPRRGVCTVVLGGDLGVGNHERNNTPPAPSWEGNVVDMIMERLKAFDEAIEAHKFLEIDGLAIHGQACDEVTQESRIKVINHRLEAAFEVEVDTVIKTPLDDLIVALETGIFIRVHGVTRIVGYYSKIHNWNKSKVAELADRRKGNYWEKQRVNTERIGLLTE